MAVEVELPRRLFTVEEYHRMAEAGIFGAEERVELIEGEVIQMAPIGPQHVGCVINATRLFITRLGDRAVISPQNPVVIRPRSEPQPDLLLLRARAVSYSRELPTSEDVLLAVEVADTTVRFDRLVKARLYARAGIAEFWLFLATDGAEPAKAARAQRLRRFPDRGGGVCARSQRSASGVARHASPSSASQITASSRLPTVYEEGSGPGQSASSVRTWGTWRLARSAARRHSRAARLSPSRRKTTRARP